MRHRIGDVQKFGRMAYGPQPIPPTLVARKVLEEIAAQGFIVLVAFWWQEVGLIGHCATFRAKGVKVRRARSKR